MKEDWLKFKKYPHIGKPLTSSNDKIWVKNYVQNPQNIIRHKFVPLLHRVLLKENLELTNLLSKTQVENVTVSIKVERSAIYITLHIWILLYIATMIASSFKHTKNIYPRKTM